MSAILKGNILNVGQLEEEIYKAIDFYGCNTQYKQPIDPCQAQRDFSKRLANAISEGVSRGVQAYLNQTVTAKTQPTLEGGGGGDPETGGYGIHIHGNVPEYNLNAP